MQHRPCCLCNFLAQMNLGAIPRSPKTNICFNPHLPLLPDISIPTSQIWNECSQEHLPWPTTMLSITWNGNTVSKSPSWYHCKRARKDQWCTVFANFWYPDKFWKADVRLNDRHELWAVLKLAPFSAKIHGHETLELQAVQYPRRDEYASLIFTIFAAAEQASSDRPRSQSMDQ